MTWHVLHWTLLNIRGCIAAGHCEWPCYPGSLLTAPTVGMQVSKLDLSQIEDHLMKLILFSAAPYGWPGKWVSFTWRTVGIKMHFGTKISQHRYCDALGNVLLENTPSPVIHVDHTWTFTIYLNIAVDPLYLFMAMVFFPMAMRSFSSTMPHATYTDCLEMVCSTWKRALGVALALKFSIHQSNQHLWFMLEQ